MDCLVSKHASDTTDKIPTCCSQIIFHVADEQKGDSPSCTIKLFAIAHPSRYCGERRLAQSGNNALLLEYLSINLMH